MQFTLFTPYEYTILTRVILSFLSISPFPHPEHEYFEHITYNALEVKF